MQNRPVPPVNGAELQIWRNIVSRYRGYLQAGLKPDRALDAVVSYLVISDKNLARSHARVVTEAAIDWTREHYPDWLQVKTEM